MCLITNQKEPIILDEDLIGYKAVGIDNISSFMEFQYEEYKLYNTEMSINYDDYYVYDDIDERYLLGRYSENPMIWKEKGLINVVTGFHFFITMLSAENSLSRIVVEKIIQVTIPSGAKVYFGFTDLAVADALKTGKL